MRVRAISCGLFCFALASLVGVAGARAAVTPVQSASIPVTTQTNWSPATPSLSGMDPLVFNQFDPNLGTLTGVNITLSYTASHTVSMSFVNSSTIMVKTAPVAIELDRSVGGALLTASVPSVTYSQQGTVGQTYSTSAPVGSQFYLTPVGVPHNTPNTPQTGSTSIALSSSSDLALFTGTGTIGLPASAAAGIATITSDSGNGSGSVQTFAGVTVTVQYTYAPVPEPSSVALLGLGGGGLLLIRRTRRRALAL